LLIVVIAGVVVVTWNARAGAVSWRNVAVSRACRTRHLSVIDREKARERGVAGWNTGVWTASSLVELVNHGTCLEQRQCGFYGTSESSGVQRSVAFNVGLLAAMGEGQRQVCVEYLCVSKW